jgi:hypothetical protein
VNKIIKAIVYQTNIGHTQRYAELLSAKTDLPNYSLDKVSYSVKKGDEIIFMGWIMAGTIKGYKKAASYYNIRAICAVGGTEDNDQIVDDLKKKHNVVNTPLFYLRGGYDLSKLRGPHGAILKQISKALISAAEKPGAKEDTIAAANDLQNNEDFVCIERLNDVLQWYAKK